jgi:hypothetical protein
MAVRISDFGLGGDGYRSSRIPSFGILERAGASQFHVPKITSFVTLGLRSAQQTKSISDPWCSKNQRIHDITFKF